MARPTSDGGSIPTAPSGPSGGSSGGGGGGGGGSAPSTSTPSHTRDPYAAAQARADRKEQQARARARKKYLAQAGTIQQQINALKLALGKKGLRKALRTQLAGVRLREGQSGREILTGYRERVASLHKTASDNEKAAAGQSVANLSNRSRERTNAISEATAQGAGESDLLRAQGASLRNWNANQGEVNRSFYDTLTSVNSSLTELTADTRDARFQNAQAANQARNNLWTDYYSDKGEVLTQLGNALGTQAEYYGLANEAVPGKSVRKKQKLSSNRSGYFFKQANLTTGQSWKDPGVGKSIRNWQGAPDIEGMLNSDVRANALTEIAAKKPEGASLREWRT